MENNCIAKEMRRLVPVQKTNPVRAYLTGKLILSTHQDLFLMDKSDILYLEADGNYTRIHLAGGETVLATKTLKQMSEHMDPHPFLRIHSTYLVNISHLKTIHKNGRFTMILKDGSALPVSHAFRKNIMDLFNEYKI